jgi:hypothetical protein
LNGARPIYQTVGYGREPLYDYLVAGLMALLGPTGRVLRFSPVPLSLLTLLVTFLWIRQAFDRPTALATAALQAVSFWALAVSRQALRSGLLPVLFAGAVFFYWRAISDGRDPARPRSAMAAPRACGYALLCAAFIGATLYTYLPARVSWCVFPLFLVYLLLVRRDVFRYAWFPTLVAVLVGWLIAVPLFVYLRAYPETEQRLAMLGEPLQALAAGDVRVILDRMWHCVIGFFVPGQGDRFLAYNIPGRPTFDLATGALFLVGFGWCLAHWRRRACALALIWFSVGISPSLVTGETASFTRSIVALPVAYLFPALAVVAIGRVVSGRVDTRARWPTWIAAGACVGLLVIVAVVSARDYFIVWGESPDVRAAYMTPLIEIADHVADVSPDAGIGISTYLPHAPHDPYVFDMANRRADAQPDPALRWFDARRALVLSRTGVLFVPAGVALDPYFTDLPGLHVRERIALRPDDADPYFDVYDCDPPVAVAALRERTKGTSPDFVLPVDWGPVSGQSVLRLLGYDLRTPEVTPGDTVELVTLWQVIDPAPLRPQDLSNVEEDWVLFTHALDDAGHIAGQEDRLDAPAWDWQEKDVVVQIHRFALRPDLVAGSVTLEVGVYRRFDGLRLSVLEDGRLAGDRVLLQPVKINDE